MKISRYFNSCFQFLTALHVLCVYISSSEKQPSNVKPRFFWNPRESKNRVISGTLQNAEMNLSEKSTITIQPIKSPGDKKIKRGSVAVNVMNFIIHENYKKRAEKKNARGRGSTVWWLGRDRTEISTHTHSGTVPRQMGAKLTRCCAYCVTSTHSPTCPAASARTSCSMQSPPRLQPLPLLHPRRPRP